MNLLILSNREAHADLLAKLRVEDVKENFGHLLFSSDTPDAAAMSLAKTAGHTWSELVEAGFGAGELKRKARRKKAKEPSIFEAALTAPSQARKPLDLAP